MNASALSVMEEALRAPVMDAVIAVTERYQYLEENRGARVYTAYREVDHVLQVGFSLDFNSQLRADLEGRGFTVLAEREGTQREHRLLLLTLGEIGFCATYSKDYFTASRGLIRHLRNLGWPLGSLSSLLRSPRCDKDSPAI
ncbi:MAG: hypothetical protein EBZ24_09870 [Synechococcaceae bacterium WB9_4xB_025]|jgi:hypothetical protein|nr:hypothetical protein [Synechococcaceae bacterium WB9_4xB_025]